MKKYTKSLKSLGSDSEFLPWSTHINFLCMQRDILLFSEMFTHLLVIVSFSHHHLLWLKKESRQFPWDFSLFKWQHKICHWNKIQALYFIYKYQKRGGHEINIFILFEIHANNKLELFWKLIILMAEYF